MADEPSITHLQHCKPRLISNSQTPSVCRSEVWCPPGGRFGVYLTNLSFTVTVGINGSSSPKLEVFPAGLRVLFVDDDPTWLKVLEKMTKTCLRRPIWKMRVMYSTIVSLNIVQDMY
ncbi:hypothetical protein L1987_80526 [Smallanthus sonchifolius]|uniref:Uncharacterized protein n=1 Tax=Smallanthus sonchifolius TaxID=185202 RepID=A0ACB8YMU9_9ASTR|nr:hypothetical protein L1987_80526 [Smallanthus sonchifolius]